MIKKFVICILLDLVGFLTSSWIFPVLGDFLDILWAPLSAYFMVKMFPGKSGKIAGLITFLEEAWPSLDFVPTFTMMWLWDWISKQKH